MLQVKVQGIFDISPLKTNYKIIKAGDEVWSGTEMYSCKYRDCNVDFMKVRGNPYTDGYIELTIAEEGE